MKTLAEKIYLDLGAPQEGFLKAQRERILDALADKHITMAPAVIPTLYPLLPEADYKITLTLSPAENGQEIVRVEAGDTRATLYGLALDIGSTELKLSLLDLNSGERLAKVGDKNPQRKFGMNILDRIIAVKAHRNNLREMSRLVRESINALIAQATEKANISPLDIGALVIAGNTCMIHLFMECDPWQIFQSPYEPVFLTPGILPARAVGMELNCNVFFMPAVANYLGGDITSGLLMTDIDTRESPAMFLDIGTNGELALGNKDFLLVGAGAAGPALEGEVSEFGMRAARGAVSGVHIDKDNKLHIETIEDAPPCGICGSGILELIAEGYLSGWIAGNGHIIPEASSQIIFVKSRDGEKSVPAIVYARDGEQELYFTQEDIIEFIKCKAAAHTMVATLLGECGIDGDELGEAYLSGGFGTHYDLEAAITVGLYPDLPRERFTVLGNSALGGAELLLLDKSCVGRVKDFQQRALYVQFGELDKFLENMVAAEFLPHTNANLYPSVKRRVQ